MSDEDTKKCFTDAHDRGDNLAGYEVEDCEDDSDCYGDDRDEMTEMTAVTKMGTND